MKAITLQFYKRFRVYLNSPENTEPRDLITDVYAPLAPAPSRPLLYPQPATSQRP
jgi:hypothetical protein